MYAGAEDPWGFRSRWYEQRKRDVTLAALTRPRYRRAFEPGCSIGVLTAALAERCDEVVAADVDAARRPPPGPRLAGHAHVRVERCRCRTSGRTASSTWWWSPRSATTSGRRDLASCSTGCGRLAGAGRDAARLPLAAPGAPTTRPPGDEVHDRVLARPELTRRCSHVEEDFRLDLLTLGAGALAGPAGGTGGVTRRGRGGRRRGAGPGRGGPAAGGAAARWTAPARPAGARGVVVDLLVVADSCADATVDGGAAPRGSRVLEVAVGAVGRRGRPGSGPCCGGTRAPRGTGSGWRRLTPTPGCRPTGW